MGTLFLDQLKKQASSFIQDKYKTARLVLTDLTQAELYGKSNSDIKNAPYNLYHSGVPIETREMLKLAEEATNNDPWGPNARTMTKIAEASFDIDDYWRIVDVLHKRLYSADWKEWRQSYKSLELLDFLLTHGPVDFAEEFLCDTDVIQELGKFKHIDEKGFNWGLNMQKKSEKVLQLLRGGETLKEARLKALKITKVIQGFGSSSPSSSTPSSSSRLDSSGASSFDSYSTTSSTWNDMDEIFRTPTKESVKNYEKLSLFSSDNSDDKGEGTHHWNCRPIHERDSLLDLEDEEDEEKDGIMKEICSKLTGISPSKYHGDKTTFRSISDLGRVMKKKIDRQFSIGY